MNTRIDLQYDFVSARRTLDEYKKKKNRPDMLARIDQRAYNAVRKMHNHLFFRPCLLEEVLIRGFLNLPLLEEPSPILAFTHKKALDAMSIVEFVGARPLNRFHNLTLIAQGAVFGGILPYRDFIPGALKKGFLKKPMIALAKFLGGKIKALCEAVHVYPVYRAGHDLPRSREQFESDSFAGPEITGMSYEEFVNFANRQTAQTINSVQQAMEQNGMNAIFLVLPEGGFRNNGAVSRVHGLTGTIALRKQRPTCCGSISYDELCPDRWRRTMCWINLSEPVDPPSGKEEIPAYFRRMQTTMQNNTVVLASHLIALALREFLNAKSFALPEFEERFHRFAGRIAKGPFAHDANLKEESYRRERLNRFYRYRKKKWLVKTPDGYAFNKKAIKLFARSERTVNDIEWNCNAVIHIRDWLLRTENS